jgi:DUF4097 and DUF4098 domain-containing protein YvlB
MSNEKRSLAPLMVGLALVVVGGFFLAVNVLHLRLYWSDAIKFLVPLWFVWIGLAKLVRHFTWDEAAIQKDPGKAALLGGLFWLTLGVILLLDFFDALDSLSFFGRYWPGLLVLFGIGKIVDFYRLKGRLPFRASEMIGVVFVVLLGMGAARLAEAHVRFVEWDWGPHLRWPVLIGRNQGAKFTVERRQETSAEGLKAVEVTNLYGDVRVEAGPPGSAEVRLAALARGDHVSKAKDTAETVKIVLTREGELLRVRTNRDELGERGSLLETNLAVRLPESVQVKITNSFGDVQISKMKAAVQLDNSSGDVAVEAIQGDVAITNMNRPVTARNIQGKLTVENRRSSVQIEDVSGSVQVTNQRGPISVERVDGPVTANNHFGRVRLAHVTGAATVRAPGSEVDLRNVSKAVRVENSHEKLQAQDLGENLDVETSNSSVRVKQVQGPVDIRASTSDVGVERTRLGVTVLGTGSQVTLTAVEGPVKVGTSLKRVTLERFRGPAEIQNEYGDIVMSPQAPLQGALLASNRNGDITLSLPRDVSCRLSAQAPGGEVVSEFTAERSPSDKPQSIEQSIGAGQPEISLQTTHARVRVRRIE